MCLIWAVKYNICGCICERESIYCTPYQYCWGPRAIIFHSNLQTCNDCWKNGDKRVNERLAKILDRLANKEQERNRRRDERSRSRHRTDKDGRTTEPDEKDREGSPRQQDSEGAHARRGNAYDMKEQNSQINMDVTESEQFQHEDAETRGRNKHLQSHSNPSRPNTPVRELGLDPNYIPPWFLSIEQNCDVTRVCDPVRISSISGNYRAPRRRTDWYALEGK